ncbi:hypothetical protein [Pedobacter alpinus]|uniref:Uncharacterized protein n=1 Tax=Pedobacter alpinus TaxID=1590643 RepID=A0ABW5TVP4_9SPHI
MKNLFLLSLLIFAFNSLYAQIEVRDSVFVKIIDLEPTNYSFSMNDGRIGLVHIYLKNRYENQSGYLTGYFGSNLTLKQKHKLDPSKVITYDQYVKLINKDFLAVLYYYKVYFIISEAKYDYLTLQVRHMSPPEFNQE